MRPCDPREAEWTRPPAKAEVEAGRVTIVTEPHTDLWQRTYYGFRNDNAPVLQWLAQDNFTFTVRTEFDYRKQFDQCGVAIYLDADNWFKASVEYEDGRIARLGSVLTLAGHSDWASFDIATPSHMWYRLSRRGPDFLVEYSEAGQRFHQMRIFHLPSLGVTSEAMGRAQPPLPAASPLPFGIYACSPGDSSFSATFAEMSLQDCLWQAHPQL